MVVRLQRPRRCRRGGVRGPAPTKPITRSYCDHMFDSMTVLDEQHREWHERRHHPGGMKSRLCDSTPGRRTARASAKKTSPQRGHARRPGDRRRPTRFLWWPHPPEIVVFFTVVRAASALDTCLGRSNPRGLGGFEGRPDAAHPSLELPRLALPCPG